MKGETSADLEFVRLEAMPLSQSELHRCAQCLEAIEDFALATPPSTNEWDPPVWSKAEHIYHDEDFWRTVLDNPMDWGKCFVFNYCVLSEWVARVPGLFHTKVGVEFRNRAESAVQYKSKSWTTYKPPGKSKMVSGGVGTLKFPPDEYGRRLVSLTASSNASSGVPLLISPDVADGHRLREGRFIEGVFARWQSMGNSGWAERFPSIKGIPKGFLVVNTPQQIEVHNSRKVPTEYHPWTVMEYYSGSAKLYDFVYATVDTGRRNSRSEVERFFKKYAKDQGRYGRYLLAADMNEPLWEADYSSPAELQRAEPGAKSQLELLQARIREESFKGQQLDSLVQFIAGKYDIVGLTRVSTIIEIPPAHWAMGGSVADAAAQLINICLQRNKVEELIDLVATEYPETFG